MERLSRARLFPLGIGVALLLGKAAALLYTRAMERFIEDRPTDSSNP